MSDYITDGEVNHELNDQIIARVCAADAAGLPITAVRGPRYDRRIKSELGIPGYNQGILCTAVKWLVEAGLLRIEEADEQQPVQYGVSTPKLYPVVTIFPA